MPETPGVSGRIGLPPDDTARALDARAELRPTVRWSEMWHADHARFFTVAKVARLDLLEDIRASLDKVLKEGGTFEQWQRDLVPTLQKAGWWGAVQDRALTGTDHTVLVGPRRLRTIFDTNLRVSRAAGLWQRIQDRKDVAPFLRYSAIMDRRTRPLHRAWHGVILPVDHPFWRDHFPPNGWHCRCTVIQLSQRDLDAAGWKITSEADLARIGALFGARARKFVRATGEVVNVPAGIAPGFAYNVGEASLRAIPQAAIASLERAAAGNLAAARATLQDIVDSAAFPVFLETPELAFPVAILNPAEAALIASERHVVVLPTGIYQKQLRRHPELTLDDYRALPGMIADAVLVVRQGEQNLLFFRSKGRLMMAIVERGEGGPNPVIKSFHFAQPRDLRVAEARGDIVLDRRGAEN